MALIPITKTDLQNAKLDAEDLAAFVSDEAGTVTPRFGGTYPNIRQLVDNFDEVLAEQIVQEETATASAVIAVASADAVALRFGTPDTLTSTSGRTLAFADNSTLGAQTMAVVTSPNGIAVGTGVTSGSTSKSVVMSSAGTVLLTGRRARLTLHHRGTQLNSGNLRAGLAFGTAGSRIHINMRGDGTIYLSNDAFTNIQTLVSSRAQAVYTTNQDITTVFNWDGAGGISFTVTTSNGVSGPYSVTSIPAGAVWFSETTDGTIRFVSPLEFDQIAPLTQAEIDASNAKITATTMTADATVTATAKVGVSQDLSKSSFLAFSVVNGGSTSGTYIATYSSGMAINVTSTTSRIVSHLLDFSHITGEDRIVLRSSNTAKTGGTAIPQGLSFGPAGSTRRHWLWSDTGAVIVRNDSEAAVTGGTIFGAGALPHSVGQPIRIEADLKDENLGTVRFYVDNVLVGTANVTDAGLGLLPLGPIGYAHQAQPVHATLVSELSFQGFNALTKDAIAKAGVPIGAYATLRSSVALPASANAPNTNNGWACTGADQIGLTGKWASCWLVGNHGQIVISGGVQTYASSIILLLPDRSKILKEWTVAGTKSIQGVCWDSVADGYWIMDKDASSNTGCRILFLSAEGVIDNTKTILFTDIFPTTQTFRWNGLAFAVNGGTKALWVPRQDALQIDLINPVAKTIIRSITASDGNMDNIDQLGFDETNNRVYGSVGANGTTGTIRFYNGTTGTFLQTITTPLSQSIEGVKIGLNGRIFTFNDGAYHTNAKPPLAISNEYEFGLGL